jgi:alpha-beta hydrolase superfamily lysophospholipase
VAGTLNAAGLAVVAHDHRGHGLAAGPGAPGTTGPAGRWPALREDVSAVNAEARRRHPGLPVVLLGHSMGSFLALRHAEQPDPGIARLVLAGSSWEPGWFTRVAALLGSLECRRQGESGRSRLVHALTFGAYNRDVGGGRTDFDWISRDEAVVDRYVADPLCGFQLDNGFWREFVRGLTALFDSVQLRRVPSDLPVLLLAGDRDPVGHHGRGPARLARALREAGSRDVTLRLYPGARHDVLHETSRRDVLDDLLAWLGGRR